MYPDFGNDVELKTALPVEFIILQFGLLTAHVSLAHLKSPHVLSYQTAKVVPIRNILMIIYNKVFFTYSHPHNQLFTNEAKSSMSTSLSESKSAS